MNRLLDMLRSPDLTNHSDWRNQADEGRRTLANLGTSISKDRFREFLDNERRMWDSLYEGVTLVPPKNMILQMRAKTVEARALLNEQWNKIERDDEANDQRLLSDYDKVVQSVKDLIKETSTAIERFPTGTMPPSTGIAEVDSMLTISTAMVNYWSPVLEKLSIETKIWQVFLDQREAARRIHDELEFSNVQKHVDVVRASSIPGDRRDYSTFKDLAVRALEGHRDTAKLEYDRFMSENKGRFIGSIEARWSSLLRDPKELDAWKLFYELDTSSLRSLLTKHEEGWVKISDSDLKSKAKQKIDQILKNTQSAREQWLRGKQIYDEFESKLR
jgi:hypothetical protein